MIKVILLEDVGKIGKAGEIILVTNGYARNYLIPKNKARPATPGNTKMLEAIKKKVALKEQEKIAEAKALADKISGLSLTISASAGEEEKLFGSVSNEMISEALAVEGVTIDKKDILLEEPIKKLGVYQVTVKILPEVRASLKVWVVKK